MSDTPRTDAIKAQLRRDWPDSALYDATQKLLYYMTAAETFGQECRTLEGKNAALLNLLSDIHDELLPYEDVDDGDEGRPRANYAMRIIQRINEVLP